MNFQDHLNTFLNSFEQKQRQDATLFYCLNDEAPDWVRDAIHDMHDDMLPNDYSYNMAQEVAEHVSEGLIYERGLDELQYETPVELCDTTYTQELLDWVGSHGARIAWVDECIADYGPAQTLSDNLSMGMIAEYQHITNVLFSAIEAQLEA